MLLWLARVFSGIIRKIPAAFWKSGHQKSKTKNSDLFQINFTCSENKPDFVQNGKTEPLSGL